MKIPALEFKQHNKTLYVGVIKASDLVKNAKADVWKPAHRKGYQRDPSENRGQKFANFINDGGTCPTSLTVSFRKEKISYKNGFLEFPDKTTKWLVDGMTRTVGAELAIEDNPNIKDFEFAIIIFNSDDVYEEAEQFYIMNKMAKRVRTDLAERFLAKSIEKLGKKELRKRISRGVLKPIYRNYEWKASALEIADKLNEDKDSAWYKKIRLPNMPKGESVIAQVSFTDSLKWALADTTLDTLSMDEMVKLVDNYWKAIKMVWEEAFTDPEVYVIQRTSGVFILNRILPTVSQYAVDKSGRKVFTVERFKKILDRLSTQYTDSDWWSVNPETDTYGAGTLGTSQKIFGNLADELKENLKTNMEEVERGDIVFE